LVNKSESTQKEEKIKLSYYRKDTHPGAMGGMVTTIRTGGKKSKKRVGVGIKAQNASSFTKAINKKPKKSLNTFKGKNKNSFTKALNK